MSELNISTDDRNITLAYDQGICPYHRTIADLVIRHAKAEQTSILDLGCGVGNTILEIQRRDPRFEFTLADVDQRCLDISQQKTNNVRGLIHLGCPADVHGIQGAFDIVLISHVIHYDSDPRATIQKMFSLLQPDGFLVLATPNPVTPTKILNTLRRRPYSAAVYTWDRTSLRNFLENLVGGLVVEVTQDFVPLPVVSRFPIFDSLTCALARCFPHLGFSIITVVQPNQRLDAVRRAS